MKEQVMPEGRKKIFDSIRHGNIMWIGMIFFASAWMFVLGIFVGRGTAPVKFDIEKLQKELIALKETVIDEEKKWFKMYMETAEKKTNLGFYEALKAPGVEDEIEKAPLRKAPVPTKKREPSGNGGAKGDRITPRSSSVAKAGSKETTLTIQVGSFKEMKAADQVVAKLKGAGYGAYRITGKVAGKGVWYRVRVGAFPNEAEAQGTMDRLKRDKFHPLLTKRQ